MDRQSLENRVAIITGSTGIGAATAHVFARAGAYEPVVTGAVLLAVYWLILFWMYRRRVFVRI